MKKARILAEEMLVNALNSVEPYNLLKDTVRIENDEMIIEGKTKIDLSCYARIFVLGAGKGAAPMAKRMEELLGERLYGGIISVKYGYGQRLKKIKIIESGHPIPDENSLNAGMEISNMAKIAAENDLVIMLISGGGSALMEMLPHGLSLRDIAELNELLISCGAAIGEINRVRQAVSLLKGGKLAKMIFPATILNFILSDVIGDSPKMIASAPTISDSGQNYAAARAVLKKYNLYERIPPAISSFLSNESDHNSEPEPNIATFVIGNNLRALRAAEKTARSNGYRTMILSNRIEGESREAAKLIAGIIKSVQYHGLPQTPPLCILAGGETTVTLRGGGKGGRNQEMVLAMLLAMGSSSKPFYFSSIGTDGTDGPTDAAGAWIDENSFEKCKKIGLNGGDFLKNNDSYHFFDKLGTLIKTGATNTNVMDIMFVICES